VKSAAIFLEDQQRRFFLGVPSLADLLANAARHHGGVLTVMERLSGDRLAALEAGPDESGGAPGSRYEEVRVGMLRGREFLTQPHIKRSKRLDDIAEALRMIPIGTGDEPLLALIGQGGERVVTISAGTALRAIQRGLKLAEELAAARLFTTGENLAALDAWGHDPRNTVRFSIRQATVDVTFILADRSRATLSIIWPEIVDMGAWSELVTAGIQLDGLLPK
jgi:hypothetical protein